MKSPVRRADKTCKIHACSQLLFIKYGKFRHLAYRYIEFSQQQQQKFVRDVKVITENVEYLARLLPQQLLQLC